MICTDDGKAAAYWMKLSSDLLDALIGGIELAGFFAPLPVAA